MVRKSANKEITEHEEQVKLQKEIEKSIVEKKDVFIVFKIDPSNPNDKGEIIKVFENEEDAKEFAEAQSPVNCNIVINPVEVE
jgi:hypothetical protein